MASRKVIVKRLASIHDLGAMTVLCTQTRLGTLTSADLGTRPVALIPSAPKTRGPHGSGRLRPTWLATEVHWMLRW